MRIALLINGPHSAVGWRGLALTGDTTHPGLGRPPDRGPEATVDEVKEINLNWVSCKPVARAERLVLPGIVVMR